MYWLARLQLTKVGMSFAVLALLLGPLRGGSQDHCGAEAQVAVAGETGSGSHHGPSDADHQKDSGGPDQCPHCPPEQCASQPTCSVQLAISLSLTETGPGALAVAQVPVGAAERSVARATDPPTPPPQRLT